MLKPSEKTPVERVAALIKRGLGTDAIMAQLNVSHPHAIQLIRLAKREMMTSEAEVRRMQRLPGMLENARRKVAALEAEARRTGRYDLLRKDAA